MSGRPETTQPEEGLAGTPAPRPMTVNEAAEAYPGEWILMMVTEHDERQHPVAGIVVVHDRRRSALVEPTIAFCKRPPPEARGFYTFSGPRFRTRAEWEAYTARRRAVDDGRR